MLEKGLVGISDSSIQRANDAINDQIRQQNLDGRKKQ
jgi:hypothetical protein